MDNEDRPYAHRDTRARLAAYRAGHIHDDHFTDQPTVMGRASRIVSALAVAVLLIAIGAGWWVTNRGSNNGGSNNGDVAAVVEDNSDLVVLDVDSDAQVIFVRDPDGKRCEMPYTVTDGQVGLTHDRCS